MIKRKVRELYDKDEIYMVLSVETNEHDGVLREAFGTEAPQLVADWALAALEKAGYRRACVKSQSCVGYSASRSGSRFTVLASFTFALYSEAELEYLDGGGPSALAGGAL